MCVYCVFFFVYFDFNRPAGAISEGKTSEKSTGAPDVKITKEKISNAAEKAMSNVKSLFNFKSKTDKDKAAKHGTANPDSNK